MSRLCGEKEALAISRRPRGQRWYGSFVVDGEAAFSGLELAHGTSSGSHRELFSSRHQSSTWHEAADHLVAALARCGVETNPIETWQQMVL